MNEHEVVIAGGGPAGMMLAAELALAKVDVAIVERRPDHVLAGSRAGGLHSRTIEVLGSARGRRSLPRRGSGGPGRDARHDRPRHERLPDAPSLLTRALAEPDRADHGRVDRRAAGADLLRMRGDGVHAGRRGRRRRARRRRVAAGAISRRLRRRTQRHPQGGGHRLPRTGSDHQQPDRRGRDGRGARARRPPRRERHPWPRPGRLRDRRRRDRLGGRGAGAGDDHRPGAGNGRAHDGRPQQGADRRLRDRLRDPRPDLDLEIH